MRNTLAFTWILTCCCLKALGSEQWLEAKLRQCIESSLITSLKIQLLIFFQFYESTKAHSMLWILFFSSPTCVSKDGRLNLCLESKIRCQLASLSLAPACGSGALAKPPPSVVWFRGAKPEYQWLPPRLSAGVPVPSRASTAPGLALRSCPLQFEHR